MNPISSEVIDEVWEEMSKIKPDNATEIVNEMTKDQPYAIVYLMAAGGDLFNQHERELLFYIGMVIWKIMSHEGSLQSQTTEELIEEMEESNVKMIEYLEQETENDLSDSVENIVGEYHQQAVLLYVIEALGQALEEKQDEIREESMGMMLIYLKTIIDCFGKA